MIGTCCTVGSYGFGAAHEGDKKWLIITLAAPARATVLFYIFPPLINTSCHTCAIYMLSCTYYYQQMIYSRPFQQQSCRVHAAEPQALCHCTATIVKRALLPPHSVTA
eukprot:406884-Pleurochrysis_carterae.AAC.1